MSELSELYQEVILDHNKKPRNFYKLEGANRHAEGFNPLCGDQITVYLKLENNLIREISFQGSGCAISKASASMMTSSLKGLEITHAQELFEKFHRMLTGKPGDPLPEGIGKLTVFSGVCEFPTRVKCATLAWHTLRSALEGKGERVTTEEEDMRNGG